MNAYYKIINSKLQVNKIPNPIPNPTPNPIPNPIPNPTLLNYQNES
jgi:hypothetical protein